jgi:hypothetical protein
VFGIMGRVFLRVEGCVALTESIGGGGGVTEEGGSRGWGGEAAITSKTTTRKL